MRILGVTLGCLLICALSFVAIKQWGRSQGYTEYKHTMLQIPATETGPRIFIKPANGQLRAVLVQDENLYLDIALTLDQKLVVLDGPLVTHVRSVNYEQIKNQTMLFSEVLFEALKIKNRKYIFNFTENAQSTHFVFLSEIKKLKIDLGDNFIVVSEYEASMKALKELSPALIFGSTKPEILRLVAMQSMYLIETASLRADIIIHPLEIRNRPFFTDEMLSEINRRFKKVIVGPIKPEELAEAQKLKPLSIVINSERSQINK